MRRVSGSACHVTKRQLMPPPRLPRHLRPCRPLWSARQVRFASDKPSTAGAGHDTATSAPAQGTAPSSARPSQAQRMRMLLGVSNASSAQVYGSSNVVSTSSTPSSSSSSTNTSTNASTNTSTSTPPAPRIQRALGSQRSQGAISTHLANKVEANAVQHSVQDAQQSDTSSHAERELRQRVKALEAQLSALLYKLPTRNVPSTEQLSSETAKTTHAPAADSKQAGQRPKKSNKYKKRTKSSPRTTKPTPSAEKSDSVEIEPPATEAQHTKDSIAPNTKPAGQNKQANSVQVASQPGETTVEGPSTVATVQPHIERAARESSQTSKSDTTTVLQHIQVQSKFTKSYGHLQPPRPASRVPPKASEEPNEQSLLNELFPEANSQDQQDLPDKRPSPPKLDLPAPDTDSRIRLAPYDARTDRQKAIDAFRARGEQITILQLSNCSTALNESDFRRLIPRGLHIETWSRDGEFYKIIPGRDPLSLARLPVYYLLFHSSESALAYQKNASRLSKLSALHAPNSIHSAIMPPAGFLEDGEDIHAVTSSFVLHPRGHQLDLRTVMQPYNRALRALIDAGGYTPIVPNVDETGKKIYRVLLHIDGYEPSHWDLWQIISRHAHARGILWPFRNEHAGALRRLRDCINLKTISKTKLQTVSTANPRAASSPEVRSNSAVDRLDYEDAHISAFLGTWLDGSKTDAHDQQETSQLIMNRVYNRWIVELDDEDAAKRFAGLWHRVVLPDAKDRKGAWKEAEEERWVQAEYLW